MWYLFTQIWAFLGLAAAVGFLVGRMVSEARLQEEVERLRRRPAEWAGPQPALVAGADSPPLSLRTDDIPSPVVPKPAEPEAVLTAAPALPEESALSEEAAAAPRAADQEPEETIQETPEEPEALSPLLEPIVIEPEESAEFFAEPPASEEAPEEAPEPVVASAESPAAATAEEIPSFSSASDEESLRAAPALPEESALSEEAAAAPRAADQEPEETIQETPEEPEPSAEIVAAEEPQEVVVPPVVTITSAITDQAPSGDQESPAPVAAREPEPSAPEPAAPPVSFTAPAPSPVPDGLQPVAGGEPTMQPVPRFEIDVSGGAVSLPVAATSEPDDLTSVVGIGPVMESKLHALGIFTFRQIAALNPHQLEYLAERLVVMKDRIERDNWIGQARELHYQKFGEYV